MRTHFLIYGIYVTFHKPTHINNELSACWSQGVWICVMHARLFSFGVSVVVGSGDDIALFASLSTIWKKNVFARFVCQPWRSNENKMLRAYYVQTVMKYLLQSAAYKNAWMDLLHWIQEMANYSGENTHTHTTNCHRDGQSCMGCDWDTAVPNTRKTCTGYGEEPEAHKNRWKYATRPFHTYCFKFNWGFPCSVLRIAFFWIDWVLKNSRWFLKTELSKISKF